MKKAIKLLASAMTLCLILTGCGSGTKGGSGNVASSGKDFVIPKNLMTTEEYHKELDALLSGDNFATADDAYLKKLDDLTDRLEEQIRYNTDDIKETSGTIYYLSNNGDDNNDGKSPETAWKTLEKASTYKYAAGDALLLERGSVFRGSFASRDNFKIGAYGNGPKPKIIAATDGKTYGKWVETETPNVWKLDKKLTQRDLGHIVFTDKDGNEICGDKYTKLSKLSKNCDFVYGGMTVEEGRIDMTVYVYYDAGNPGEVFDEIELPLDTSVITVVKGRSLQNFEINNLELLHGRGPFWPHYSKNISMTYCVIGWCGGFADAKGGVRYGGGSGAWHSCDGFVYDHCYFYQQYDSGVSPQYDGDEEEPAVFKDFKTTNCLFKTTEYTLEYFNSQKSTTENRFENMYFAYNICREGGYGFGTKPSASAYIKSWGHENSCYNCQIEYNVFDRAASTTLEINGHEQSASGNTLSYERIPKLNNNIYIQKENKKFAIINKITYKYNQTDIQQMISLGIDKNSRYLFSNDK